MTGGREIVSLIGQRQDLKQFRKKNWEGTFDQYLDLVTEDSCYAQRLSSASTT